MHVSIKCFIFAIFSMFLGVFSVSAMSYTPTTNLFENSYSNNLIDMAMSQIDNFESYKYAIFQVDNNYYLVASKDYSVNGTTITFTNSTIFSVIRNTTGGYSSYYSYLVTEESTTSIYANYTVISNIDMPLSVTSSRFNNYSFNANAIRLLMFLLGIVFAIFLTKGRSYL